MDVESLLFAVIYNDKTMVRSLQRYLTIKYFLLIEQQAFKYSTVCFMEAFSTPFITWLNFHLRDFVFDRHLLI